MLNIYAIMWLMGAFLAGYLNKPEAVWHFILIGVMFGLTNEIVKAIKAIK